ncbi:hypothetical protein QCA50_005667 [Cerrena zonata]|uniref:Uncharacterized protein n=1 Tax=Cerrena zonata TaxID=2478898 RepID=A0AAW0GFT8_9APHY
MDDAGAEESDSVTQFLAYAQRVINSAQFVVDAIPNVEDFKIERSLQMIGIVKDILQDLDDPWLDDSDIDTMFTAIDNVESPLRDYQAMPPLPRNMGTTTTPSALVGRPSYNLDLEHAIELHDLGNSYC